MTDTFLKISNWLHLYTPHYNTTYFLKLKTYNVLETNNIRNNRLKYYKPFRY